MHIEKLKLFLHGLPPDCQGSTLKDFLEGNVLNSYGKSTYVCEVYCMFFDIKWWYD